MIHARTDYQRIQDPLGKIADDEPVFLLRAQDDFFIPMLLYYVRLNETVSDRRDGRAPRILQRITQSLIAHVEIAREWRRIHKVKLPDMPEDSVRKGDKNE